MKELKINIPEGYEIDKENSSFECIKFKKKKEIKTWNDLCNYSKSYNDVRVGGYCIGDDSNIYAVHGLFAESYNVNVFASRKEAKSALAMSKISQLMPYYGGAISDEEWDDVDKKKYVIERTNNIIRGTDYRKAYCYLAFHTKKQRDRFLKHNEQLVKEYLMLN